MPLKVPFEFKTPAKVNFYLRIQEKRNDGYHNLLLDLIPVSLFDHIRIENAPSGIYELNSSMDLGSPGKNLITRAVRLLEKEANITLPIRVTLTKNIPVGAGLGGGSGNAGGILVVLNRLFKLGLSTRKLLYLASGLGADVPFFINPVPSRAWGVGTDIVPIKDFSSIPLLILYPKIEVKTADAYRNCRISSLNKPNFHYDLEGLRQLEPEWNDFWPYLKRKHEILEALITLLGREGAIGSGLSGSGSAVFGVFEDKNQRDRANDHLMSQKNFVCYRCETLDRFVYEDISK
ncbi:MAG: 4-(cytidine 5'-diphospho)-2-C-methyl-D-erythritol kinase [Deltaproteobacteria bacterium]|nr:4-(cytidine 5'-diphospho)-2-C-methyl-D-erythritol kinase [Deltaproteobacteria bacterium]